MPLNVWLFWGSNELAWVSVSVVFGRHVGALQSLIHEGLGYCNVRDCVVADSSVHITCPACLLVVLGRRVLGLVVLLGRCVAGMNREASFRCARWIE